jgi:hypothetical protein
MIWLFKIRKGVRRNGAGDALWGFPFGFAQRFIPSLALRASVLFEWPGFWYEMVFCSNYILNKKLNKVNLEILR